MLSLTELNLLSRGELEEEYFRTKLDMQYAQVDFEEREKAYRPFCAGSVRPDIKVHMMMCSRINNYLSLVAQVLDAKIAEEPIFQIRVKNMKVRIGLK